MSLTGLSEQSWSRIFSFLDLNSKLLLRSTNKSMNKVLIHLGEWDNLVTSLFLPAEEGQDSPEEAGLEAGAKPFTARPKRQNNHLWFGLFRSLLLLLKPPEPQEELKEIVHKLSKYILGEFKSRVELTRLRHAELGSEACQFAREDLFSFSDFHVGSFKRGEQNGEYWLRTIRYDPQRSSG